MIRAHHHHPPERRRGLRPTAFALGAACAAAVIVPSLAWGTAPDDAPPKTLEDARLLMGKWIETQQIIAKERNDWEQGRQILDGRLKLVKDEIAALEEKIAKAEAAVKESTAARDTVQAESDALKVTATQLTTAVASLEAGVRRIFPTLPEPIRARLQPLAQRMPKEPTADAAATGEAEAKTKTVSVAERFQNVLGILNEVSKANTEISVNYEVRTLASGKPAEVRALYIGLAQAYFVSSSGEAGIGRPTPEGWKWESSNAIAGDVLTALEIIQGKHTPAFVPLPVKIQ